MLPTLTINPVDGSVSISNSPLTLSKGLDRARAFAALRHHYRSNTDHGNGYEWLSFDGVSFGGAPSGFSICFHDHRLTEIHFGVSLPNLKLEDGWPTRQSIDEEVAFVQSELTSQLGRQFTSGQVQFSWGTVWSMFDAKGFLASAGLRYAA